MALSTADRLDLRRLVEQYFSGVDRNDPEAIAECFSTDCCFRMTVGEPVDVLGRAGVRKAVSVPRAFAASDHSLSHHMVSESDDTVVGTTNAVAHLVFRGEEERGRVIVRGVRYDDEYVVEDGQWRIGRRIHQPVWQYEAEATPVGLDHAPT